MEEKEKMMKQQELQHRLKAQAAIQPKPVASNTTKANSRDLSSSLLENDFMSNIVRPGPLPMASTSPQWAAQPAPSSFQPNLMGVNAFGGSQVRPSQPSSSSGRTMDLTALDDLLPSKPKTSMNQLGSSSSGNQSNNWNSGALGQSGTSAGMRHSGSMGSMAPAVNSNAAMGNSRTMGNFGGMSTHGTCTSMPFQGVQSTLPGVLGGAAYGTSNPFLRPPGTGLSLMQPKTIHQSDSNTGSMPLSNKDIADLLG